MKKNLMSILILALLVVNLVLTAIMMFSVTGAMKNTTALVGKIASVLDLELNMGAEAEVSSADLETFNISEDFKISLSAGADGNSHVVILSVSIQLNTKADGYKKNFIETLTENERPIRGFISEVVSSYTLEEFNADQAGVRDAVLARLRKEYGTDCFYRVIFSDVMTQ